MKYPVQQGAMPNHRGSDSSMVWLGGDSLMNYPVKPGALAKPLGKLFPDGLIKGRLIDDSSCDIGGVGQTIGEIIARWFG